jgi:drug/metabolite transporter (DMT)-like permease
MSGPPTQGAAGPAAIASFTLVALIWGLTWWVITGQIDGVPPSWSVVWRFAMAAPAMFLVAIATGCSLRLGAAGQRLALLVGVTQFCGNYNFVYRAEMHLTSGIVAVMLSLLPVPNALLARGLLKQPITRRFIAGGVIAVAGIALLLLNEAREAEVGGKAMLGIAFAVIALLCASFSNVMQGNATGQTLPMASLLAWAMLYGAIADVGVAFATSGPPVIPASTTYWMGTAYLAILGSVVTFPLYYTLVRRLGAGRAAYNGVAVVIIAMLISTVLEGYRWSLLTGGGAALALAGLVIALSARRPAA